ncbi:peptidoglycan D,D-transpeptidase FtsI family protein [Tepidibacillus fermentans]|uniref:serine-type D-Ala-D-Ala carboxypeptidase n=1 Tax=Tepidibacillus fermentans TaxID=1281767 RepID=A0A4R3KJL4_9BACI|nr:penicillin-binding transpeptidase domain-containing protein [Tepidibacillus fermentans]TCS83799.1 cell division protein FtsI/penicillin-binding protein 2 [Tepidibacillus fermentans]
MSIIQSRKKRMFRVMLLIVFLFGIVIGRLAWIQIIATKDFSKHHINLIENSVKQRQQSFVLSSGRGNIYDRHGISLLGEKELQTVIVFPFIRESIERSKIEALTKILQIDEQSLVKQLKSLKRPTYLQQNGQPITVSTYQQKEIESLQIPGIIVSNYHFQDEEQMVAKHLIGFLANDPKEIEEKYHESLEEGLLNRNSLIGRSGLQKTFQEILQGTKESKIAYFVDNQGKPLNGLASKYQIQEDQFYPLSLVTTIDKEMQKATEEILQKELQASGLKEGSIVILDTKNADILAMASAPDFNLNQVDPNSTNWNNKAVQVIEPGSIFKTLIAIAAMEEGVVKEGEKFFCSGDYGSEQFTCSKAHGEITFEEGFAESCNIVFGELAKRLGPEKIEEYAEKLGLVGIVGWTDEFFKQENFKQIDNEQSNRVFYEPMKRKDLGSILRTGIGQQDVRISPLAAANLIVTILHHGEVYQPRLVEKVIYKNETEYFEFPIQKRESLIGNERSYERLKKMMEKVVDEGTGRYLNQARWDLAGKSGTAETSVKGVYNSWFIGYGPVERPRYAIAVAIKNVDTRSLSELEKQVKERIAKKIFLELMDELALKKK